jgi:hypothetical protein
MTLKIQGTYRSRLYINLILFRIARGWKEERFERMFTLPDAHRAEFEIPGLPVKFDATLYRNQFGEWWVTLGIGGNGYSLGHVNPSNSNIGPLMFKAEPIKGVILEGTIEVSE